MAKGDMNGMAKAQREHDNPRFPEDFSCEVACDHCMGTGEDGGEWCDDCNGTGVVTNHKWKRIPGEGKDGTTYCQCVRCGQVEES